MISLQKEIQQLDSLQHKIHKLDTLDTPNWTATIPLNTSDISEKLQQIDPIKTCTFMHQIQNMGTDRHKQDGSLKLETPECTYNQSYEMQYNP